MLKCNLIHTSVLKTIKLPFILNTTEYYRSYLRWSDSVDHDAVQVLECSEFLTKAGLEVSSIVASLMLMKTCCEQQNW